ncbi:MAG TPA: hypothetical protein VK151_02275 [Fluviicola sp.]|nr:hypothetical protein [Fluviicola sp.]
MKFLFKKRTLIIITILIVICLIISLLFQTFFVESRDKNLNAAISNSSLVKFKMSIRSKICDVTNEHDYVHYILDDYKSSCYFGLEKKHEATDARINNFIKKNETILFKIPNDSIVYFINKNDTLKIVFCVDKKTKALENGVVSQSY